MISLYNSVITLAIGLAFSFGVMAESITEQQHKSVTNNINAEYRVAKNKCSLLSGVAEDSCLAQAKAAKTKAIAGAKPRVKTSKACAAINNKKSGTSVEAIDEDYEEDEIESAVTEVKPIESDIIPLGKDIFRDRIKIVAMK